MTPYAQSATIRMSDSRMTMHGVLNSVRHAVGNTPLVRAARFAPDLGNDLLIKLEFMNPGGSIKDRIAFAMVEDAVARGVLRPGGEIIEATAGNTGMGLAMAAGAGGFRLTLVMTTKASVEKVELMRSLGVEVVIVPKECGPEHPDYFRNKARSLAEARGAFWIDQFSNPANVAAHFEGTGREIWEQTEGRVDVVVAGIGTGGSLTGIGRYLKSRKPGVKMVLADPAGSILKDMLDCGSPGETGSYIAEGIGGSMVPHNADLSILDAAVRVTDAETVGATLRLFRTEGIFAGSSTGAIVAAAVRYCRENGLRDRVIVALAPDGGRGYLSNIYNPEWRRERGFVEAE